MESATSPIVLPIYQVTLQDRVMRKPKVPQPITLPEVKRRSGWQSLPIYGAVLAKPSAANLSVRPKRNVGTCWDLNTSNKEGICNSA
jgi:hypothetical protein